MGTQHGKASEAAFVQCRGSPFTYALSAQLTRLLCLVRRQNQDRHQGNAYSLAGSCLNATDTALANPERTLHACLILITRPRVSQAQARILGDSVQRRMHSVASVRLHPCICAFSQTLLARRELYPRASVARLADVSPHHCRSPPCRLSYLVPH